MALQHECDIVQKTLVRLFIQHISYIHSTVQRAHRCCLCLTLTVLVGTIDAQWEGMGDVGSARYEPALLPPCPTISHRTRSCFQLYPSLLHSATSWSDASGPIRPCDFATPSNRWSGKLCKPDSTVLLIFHS